jgi:EH_Signature domain
LLHEAATNRSNQGVRLEAPKALVDADKRLASLAEAKLQAPTSSRREQALGAWEAWKSGSGTVPKPVILRTLCWEPGVVADERFRPFLGALRPLRARTLQALVPTYLRLWREGGDAAPELSAAIRDGLAALAKPRGVVARWREASGQLFGDRAAEAFANEAMNQRKTVRSRVEELSLATDTEFASSAAGRLLKLATSGVRGVDEVNWLLDELLPQDSPIAGEAGWGPALSNLILNESLAAHERTRERILDFALRDLRLGDPRVSSVPWHPIGEKATREVIRWRSSEDLRFFFDLVMKGKPDHQGRHRFWQKYVDGVTRSLIVLSRNDEDRLRRRLRDLETRGRRFAQITGTNLTSAFVMEFADTVIVEFSEAGNACYVYQEGKGKDPIPWQASTVDLRVLKNPKRAKTRLIHGQRWEHDFASSLARRGIRPVSPRKARS